MCLSGRSLSSLQVRPRYQTVSYAAVRLSDKYGMGFFLSLERILDVLFQLNNLIHGGLLLMISKLFCREQWINNWLNTGIDMLLEDLVEDTDQRFESITLWVPRRLHQLWGCDYQRSSSELESFKSAQSGRN